MFRKMLTSNVATLALAAGFATALAAPAGAVTCDQDVSTFDFDLESSGKVTCTIDFTNLDGSPSLSVGFEYWGVFGAGGERGRASGAPPIGAGEYQYNVFGTTERIASGATSGSADLIILGVADDHVPTGGFASGPGAGFGVGINNSQGVAELINENKRLEFMFRDPTGGRNDEAGGFDRDHQVGDGERFIRLENIQIVSFRVGQSFAIEAFDAGDASTGIVNLVTTAGLAAGDAADATTDNAGVATYEVGLTGVRFQIVGTQLAATGGPSGGAAGDGLYGVRVRGATFVSGIPLPGALIPALTGLAALGGLGAARRRRQKAE